LEQADIDHLWETVAEVNRDLLRVNKQVARLNEAVWHHQAEADGDPQRRCAVCGEMLFRGEFYCPGCGRQRAYDEYVP